MGKIPYYHFEFLIFAVQKLGKILEFIEKYGFFRFV